MKKVAPEMETDYTDYAYQVQLPMHARSTATKAIKNNLRLTEVLADQNNLYTAQKVCGFLSVHWNIFNTIEVAQKPLTVQDFFITAVCLLKT